MQKVQVKQYFFEGAQMAELLKAAPFRETFGPATVFDFRWDQEVKDGIVMVAVLFDKRTKVSVVDKIAFRFTRTELINFLNANYSAGLDPDSRIDLKPKTYLNGKANQVYLVISHSDDTTSNWIRGI